MANIDAQLENADWTKLRWPYPDVPPEAWQTVPLEDLVWLVSLPVWANAPAEVREIAAARLSAES